MRNFILLGLLILVGCGQKQVTQFKVDPEIMPFFEKVMAEGSNRNKSLATS